MVHCCNGGAVLDIRWPCFRAGSTTVSASLLWYANQVDYTRHDSGMDLTNIPNVGPLASLSYDYTKTDYHYNRMLSGTLAQLIAPSQPPDRRMPIIIGAIGFQGLGWMIALLMYAAYIHRLMGYGLPDPDLRPGMFISVGPPSFTGLALIGLANALPDEYGYFPTRPLAVQILGTVADFTAIFLWTLGFWFFCITLIAVIRGAHKMSFHMIWWGAVFPNVGFAIATIKIGEELESEGILWVGSAMTILLVAGWMFVFVAEMRAIIRKDIIMPGKDEDKGKHAYLESSAGKGCAPADVHNSVLQS